MHIDGIVDLNAKRPTSIVVEIETYLLLNVCVIHLVIACLFSRLCLNISTKENFFAIAF